MKARDIMPGQRVTLRWFHGMAMLGAHTGKVVRASRRHVYVKLDRAWTVRVRPVDIRGLA